ncbi:MAG: alpha/beta fold hydrolase [Spirochaetia bacterium]
MLYYTAEGNGPSIVFLHGLFGSGDNWSWFVKRYFQNYYCILPDLPNHGSSEHSGSCGYQCMATSIINLLDRLEIQEAVFIGHSLGGRVAQKAALLHPDRVKALISLDAGPGTISKDFSDIFAGIKAVEQEKPSNRKAADTLLSQHIASKQVRMFLLKSYKPNDSNSYQWVFHVDNLIELKSELFSPLEINGKYKGSSLFIQAEVNPFLTDKEFETINNAFPNSEVQTMNKAGHWMHAERPEETASAIGGFLASL